MLHPELVLVIEDQTTMQTRVFCQGLAVLSRALAKPVALGLSQSFGFLLVQIHNCQQAPSLLINGKQVFPRSIGGVYELRLPLDGDLMLRRIAVIAAPFFALTVDVQVTHRYHPKGWPVGEGVEKWTLTQFKTELARYRELFLESNQNSYVSDESNYGVALGAEDSFQLIPQVVGRIELLLSSFRPDDALEDFHFTTQGDFDLPAILAELKQHPLRMTLSDRGCIAFKQQRYSTTLNMRLGRASSRFDFSEVCAVLDYCASAVLLTSVPSVLHLILSSTEASLRDRYPFKAGVDSDFEKMLSRPMKSTFGSSLQGDFRVLVAALNNLVRREALDLDLLWLSQAIADKDVFEKSVFACCAKAFKFTHQEVISSRGLISRSGIAIADTNMKIGMDCLEASLTSWRKQSIQPSGFHPDTYVLLGDKPVVIDAKFRMPKSTEQLAEAGGLKDVQAYMHDFSLRSAVIVVPKIIASSGFDEDRVACIKGNGQAIYIVEMQDSEDPIVQARLRKAIGLAADAA
jgi:hypothetical protein